jgi:N-acetylglucosamine-6-phosphate deacetylase
MKSIAVKNLYSSGKRLENQKITIQNGQIVEVSPSSDAVFDYENIAPALIDIHINGGEQFHFTADPTEETLKDIEFSAQKNGVGFVLPALITSSPENIFRALEVTKKYISENPNSGIIGLHLEGPFISEKKRGAHLTKYIRTPDDQLLQEIITQGAEVLKMITIAPEHFTDRQISMLVNAGITVSLGHSNCTYKRAMEAFNLGVNLVTHLFNAMSPLHHREPGLLGAAFANEKVFTPVIPDGVHADYEAVKLAIRLKGDKLFFISDALFQNHIKTAFKWEEFDAKLINGDYINADGNLAGATISMADCVKNGVEVLGLSLEKSIEKSTGIPAKVLKIKAGKIEPSYPAKFCTFDNKLKELKFLNFQ